MRNGIYKQILISAVSCGFALNACAVGNGFYMGLMMGPATNSGGDQMVQVDNPHELQTTPASPRSTQFGTRIFMGNQFSQYAAIEGGLTFFSTIKYDSKGVDTCSGNELRVRDLDVVVKGIIPFGNYFDIYGKAGMAISYITTSGGLNPTFDLSANPPVTCGSNTYKNKFSPTVSFGATYDINQSWVADLSYNTVQVSTRVSTVSLIALGISYHFTDKYCGQFLCDD